MLQERLDLANNNDDGMPILTQEYTMQGYRLSQYDDGERTIPHRCGQYGCHNFVMVNGLDLLTMSDTQFFCDPCEDEYVQAMEELENSSYPEPNTFEIVGWLMP